MSLARTLKPIDWVFLLLTAVLVGVAAVLLIKPHYVPEEDAAMLMVYSKHLAQGLGIVYNVGQSPVDGATDFLFMVLVAGINKLGISLETSVLVIGCAAQLITAWIVYLSVRLTAKASPWLALAAAAAFSFSGGIPLTAIGFGTPLFALFCACSWMFAMLIAAREGEAPNNLSAFFAFSSLLAALTRPEGVFMTAFMLLAIIYFKSWKQARPVVLWYVGVFTLLGGSYFVWRWLYFGYPLPNPFYKKGGGHLHLDGLQLSISNMLNFALLFIPIVAAGLCVRFARAKTVFCMIPIVLFTGIWVLLSSEMNHLGRFQYPMVPLVYMSWPLILVGLHGDQRIRQMLSKRVVNVSLSAIGAVLLALFSFNQFTSNRTQVNTLLREPVSVRIHGVAEVLSKYKDFDYKIATTESGILPLYSGWQSVDTWGLNDKWIAHHRHITTAYLAAYNPDLIVLHAPYTTVRPPQFSYGTGEEWSMGKTWFAMNQVVIAYADSHNFQVAACCPDDNSPGAFAVYYFVNPKCPGAAAISKDIHRYCQTAK